MNEREEEDERRESAIASTPILQPTFNPNRSLSRAQISKFQELHRRRLEIKSKSKFKTKKQKDGISKSSPEGQRGKDCEEHEGEDEDSRGLSDGNGHDRVKEKSETRDVRSQRRKLHWGLDTKEWWERKSNM